MRKFLSILFATMLVGQAWAQNYDFSAVCSSGQRLYYKITSDAEPYTVAVTYPQKSYPYYSESSKPKGSVLIPENVSNNEIEYAVTSIGENAFFQCDSLISVTIPNSVTNIGRAAFDACHCLESANIPDGVTKIEDYTFAYCFRLESITIPDGVTQIGGNAFEKCYSLTSLVVPNSVTKIGGKAFGYIKNVIYTGSATGEWDELNLNGTVDNDGFMYGDSAKTIISAYVGKGGNVIIPNAVTTIDWCAFYGCGGLTSVTIPKSVTYIGDNAFGNCSSLTTLTIPNSVTEIGYGAFDGCDNLKYVVIPKSVKIIDSKAFDGYHNRELTIYCEADNKPYGWSSDWVYFDTKIVWNSQVTFATINAKANNAAYGSVVGVGNYPLLLHLRRNQPRDAIL